ncbi:MAG: hypothetical protein A2144_01425 [Chloroflexi bacterium RBG_16_50_9]|nr:MAG: hypothetical protein A2144_01425 [Chloroflexi bacterium RBG_16_50_9]
MTALNFKIRRYQRSDLANIEKLLGTHFETDRVPTRALVFDWIAGHNPAADGETCYLVIEADNKIVAYEGRMPVDLMINGEKERGYFFHDTLVHPEYRKKGMGLTFVNSLKGAWEDATDTFALALWMNQFTHEMLKRRGYYETQAHYFVKPMNLTPVLVKVTRNKLVGRVMASAVHGLMGLYDFFIAGRRHPDIKVSPIERFDRRFDEFAGIISKKFTLIVLRHTQYLNWKYTDKPSAGYTVFSAERNGVLTGYIVLLPRKIEDIRAGVIVDILAAPDDTQTIASLCQAAINYFKKEDVNFIVCVLTDRRFIRVFKKFLFFKRRKSAPVFIANIHKHSKQELIKDIDNWFLTFGDSDGVLWP